MKQHNLASVRLGIGWHMELLSMHDWREYRSGVEKRYYIIFFVRKAVMRRKLGNMWTSEQASDSFLYKYRLMSKKETIIHIFKNSEKRWREKKCSSVAFSCWADFARPLAGIKTSPISMCSHVIFVIILNKKCWW